MILSAAMLIAPRHKLPEVLTHTNDCYSTLKNQSREYLVQHCEDQCLRERIERVFKATYQTGVSQ